MDSARHSLASLFTCSFHNNHQIIRLWDPRDPHNRVGELQGHDDVVKCLAMSHDGTKLLSGCSGERYCERAFASHLHKPHHTLLSLDRLQRETLGCGRAALYRHVWLSRRQHMVAPRRCRLHARLYWRYICLCANACRHAVTPGRVFIPAHHLRCLNSTTTGRDGAVFATRLKIAPDSPDASHLLIQASGSRQFQSCDTPSLFLQKEKIVLVTSLTSIVSSTQVNDPVLDLEITPDQSHMWVSTTSSDIALYVREARDDVSAAGLCCQSPLSFHCLIFPRTTAADVMSTHQTFFSLFQTCPRSPMLHP